MEPKIIIYKEKIAAEAKARYSKAISKFKGKKPKKLEKFSLELIKQTETKKLYKTDGLILEENFGTLSEFYPLTNNEVLSIITYYEVKNLDITILHYKQENIQAMVSVDMTRRERVQLMLKIPSKLAEKMKKLSLRGSALHTLLHEVSHLLGNIANNDKCEPEADRFADKEMPKWRKLIDITDLDEC